MLKRGEVYFASPNELNDAQECRPYYIFKGKKEVWSRFIHYLFLEICFRYNLYSGDEASNFIKKNNDLFESIYPKIRNRNIDLKLLETLILGDFDKVFNDSFSELEKRKIYQSINHFLKKRILSEMEEPRYLASFSTVATNPTMWGHYSEADTGFIVIYRSDDNKLHVKSSLNNLDGIRERESGVHEIGMYDSDKLELKKVEYLKRPTKINAFSRLIPKFYYTEQEYQYDVSENLPSEITDYEENKFGLYKYSDWKYEKEIRAFFPTYRTFSSQVRSLGIDEKQIVGIIFGSKMTKSNKEKAIVDSFILKYGNGKDQKPDDSFYFFNAVEQSDKFELSIDPIGILKDYYYGDSIPITLINQLDSKSKTKITELSEEIIQQSS